MIGTPEVFDRNLAALRRLLPALAERIAARPSPGADVEIFAARSGRPTGRARAEDGAWVQLHSRVDPEEEARRFAEAVRVGRDDAFALAGLGLGYPAFALLPRLPEGRWVLLIETREDVFRAAMEHVDWTPVWRRPRTVLFVGTDYSAFLDTVHVMLASAQANSVTVIRHPVSHRLDGALYQRMEEDLARAVVRRHVELTTLLRYADQMEDNAVANLPEFVEAAGAGDFAGAFADVPAFLVAAGPSLNEAIPHLRQIGDDAVIIAVDKCTKLLLREGVRPHFTALLDMTGATRPFYEGVSREDAPVLVFDSDAFHETVASYPGARASFETTVPWSQWAASVTRPRGMVPKGISVSHTAFHFLLPLGPSPIVFVGVDLAFPTGTTHAEGVEMNWGGRAEAQPDLVQIPSVRGGTVLSNVGFQTFVTLFEVTIGRSGAKVINTSPAGALIRGTENVPIGDVVRSLPRKGAGVSQRIRSIMDRVRADHRPALREATDRLLEALERVRSTCADAEPLLRRICRLDPTNRLDQPDYARLAHRLNRMRDEVLAQKTVLRLLQRLVSYEGLACAMLEREKADLDPGDLKARSQIERQISGLFFSAYSRACAATAERLRRMRARLA